MRIPSPFNFLAIVALAVATCVGPVFACVCADGTTTVQSFARFCDGPDHDSDGDGACEEGCEASRVAGDVPTAGNRTITLTPPQPSPLLPVWSAIDLGIGRASFVGRLGEVLAVPHEARLGLRCVILIV